MSKNRIYNSLANFFLGIHWEGYHLVHHLKQTIPSWHYKKAHNIMLNDPWYRELSCHKRPGFRQCLQLLYEETEDYKGFLEPKQSLEQERQNTNESNDTNDSLSPS
jgi:fatty acid desaturase